MSLNSIIKEISDIIFSKGKEKEGKEEKRKKKDKQHRREGSGYSSDPGY